MKQGRMVALHGNLGSGADWAFLGEGRVEAVDLWQHTDKSFGEMARTLAELAQADLPLLLGYSLGGRLALDTLTRYPEKWRGAVIVSAHPGLSCTEDRVARARSDRLWADRAREMRWEAFLEAWDNQGILAGVAHVPKERYRLAERREEVALGFENWSLGKQRDLRKEISGSEGPVLWVTGERDGKFTELGREMAQKFPNMEHRVVPACGHRVPFEAPEGLAELILEFQDRLID